MHRFLLHNDDIRDAGDFGLSPGQVGLLAGWGVFSTLRVYDGVMFAFDRHWERMRRDAARMRVPFPAQPEWLESRLQRLIEANQSAPGKPLNATLRVVIVRNRGGLYEGPAITRDFDVIAFTVDMVRWPETVKLGVVPHGRHAASEFAGTKYTSWAENLTRYERAHQQGLDEVILLNERGEVAECTSANVFMVDSGAGNESRVWTPPLSSGGLGGVTRAVLLEEIRDPRNRHRREAPAARRPQLRDAKYSSRPPLASCSRSSALRACRFKAAAPCAIASVRPFPRT